MKVFREYKYFPLVTVLMSISTVISIVYPVEASYETDFFTTSKRLLQFITSFWYFFFFKYYFETYKVSINKVYFYSIIYIAIYALFYFFNREAYANIKIVINPVDNHTRRILANDYSYIYYRFNFLWSDPNNVAYAVGTLLLTFLSKEHGKFFFKILAFILGVFVLLCTQSIGGVSSMAVSLFLLFLFKKKSFIIKKTKFYSTIFSIIVIALLIIYFFPIISDFFNSDIINDFTSRVDYYDDRSDSSGGRGRDFFNSLKYLNPIFLLVGCGIEGFVYEIGHMYIIFMYGLPVYIYFMYILFWRKRNISWSRLIPLIPMFTGFTMNIAIIDQKYLLILLFTSAYLSVLNLDKKLVN